MMAGVAAGLKHNPTVLIVGTNDTLLFMDGLDASARTHTHRLLFTACMHAFQEWPQRVDI